MNSNNSNINSGGDDDNVDADDDDDNYTAYRYKYFAVIFGGTGTLVYNKLPITVKQITSLNTFFPVPMISVVLLFRRIMHCKF